MMSNRKMSFVDWQAKQLATIPNCCAGTGGEGEKTFFSILRTCARKYPENLEEFAVRFNSEKCVPLFSPGELRHKILDARRLAGLPGSYVCLPVSGWHTRKLRFNPQKVQRLVKTITEDVDEEFLRLRSPIVPDAMNATSFLKCLYKKGEKIFVTDNVMKKQPSELVVINDVMHSPTLDRIAVENESGVWFLPNPVSGQWVESTSGRSMRCAAALTAWRYCVVESDTVAETDWLKILCSLPLPVAAIYRSGGRSVHSLIKIDAVSAEDWKIKIAPLKNILIPLGSDPAAMRVSQLSRLPQCLRTDKGRWQKLLYLDPEPDGVPIIQKPLRESGEAILKRLENARHFLAEDGEQFAETILSEGGRDGK